MGDWFVQRPNASAIDSTWCEKNAVKPKLLIQAHSAPLDIKFGPKSDPRAYGERASLSRGMPLTL